MYRRNHRSGLGDVTSAVSAASAIASDPCLPQAITIVNRIAQTQAARTVATATGTKPAAGVGLCSAMPALRAYEVVMRSPWVLPVGVVAVAGALVGIGYLLAKRGR